MMQMTTDPIDSAALRDAMEDSRAGAFTVFEGWVRDLNDDRAVERLEYEAYAPLCLTEGETILAEARERFAILGARCTHRTGLLELGECAVWVGVVSAHRDEAFQACRFIIDEIKLRLPIWKKEHYVEGPSEWVNCERCAKHAPPPSLGESSESV